jgi:hypothetical protein
LKAIKPFLDYLNQDQNIAFLQSIPKLKPFLELKEQGKLLDYERLLKEFNRVTDPKNL